jgi:hypothetical protein
VDGPDQVFGKAALDEALDGAGGPHGVVPYGVRAPPELRNDL